jgi:biotin-(acetyl-CoA carboxylase) ligase
MIEVVNTTIEATTQENQVTEATTNTMTLKTPEPTDLLQSLMKLLDEHIEKKIADALAQHIDAVRDVAREIAEEVATQTLEDHTTEYDHDDYDDISNGLDEKINDAIYDYDMDDKIKDSLSSALEDVDLEDKIKDALRDMTFNVSVD